MLENDDGRAYWGRHANNYDRAMVLLGGPIPTMARLAGAEVRGLPCVLEIGSGTGVLKPGGRLIVPTYCHDETTVSRTVSRLLALTGVPGRRRFTTTSLRQSLEAAGLQITQSDTLPGVIPIAFVAGTFGVP